MIATRVLGVGVVAALVIAVVVVLVNRGSGGSGTVPSGEQVSFDTGGWKTDFGKHSVPLSEFSSGGPPRDGIPPIDKPKFVSVAEADRFLSPREPVISVVFEGRARAYPLQILTWHEIANDDFDGRPIAVTFCPLCNSSIVFDRRLDGQTLRFGTTGNLRNSDLVMWDDKTESWWQQLTGTAIVGSLTDKKLTILDSQILSWKDFSARYPDGKVLSRDTGHDRPYGENPYTGYDDVDSPPFALDASKLDDRLPPKLRVSAVTIGERTLVFPFDRLEKAGVMQGEISDTPVAVFFKKGLASALDRGSISDGRDVGTAAAFDRRLEGRMLTFETAGDTEFRDKETGSTWDITGRARSGSLEGKQLKPVQHDEQFWFAIAAFDPDARIAG